MAHDVEIRFGADMRDAVVRVLGCVPTAPESLLVLAHFLNSLADGFGLSESDHLDPERTEHAVPDAPVLAVVERFLGVGGPALDHDVLRDTLYAALVAIAEDTGARRTLNKRGLSSDDVLRLGQVYWSLEVSSTRPRLPLAQGRIHRDGRSEVASIKHPRADKDLAWMQKTDRTNEKDVHASSGANARKQGAMLAVLAARWIVDRSTEPMTSLDGARLRHSEDGKEPLSVVWPGTAGVETPVELPPCPTEPTAVPDVDVPRSTSVTRAHRETATVVVGRPGEVGAGYQRRGFDDEIDKAWHDGGDRRVWLVGGPGLGKSYTARRIWQEALAAEAIDRPDLMVWVDSADAGTVREVLADANDRLRANGHAVPGLVGDPDDQKAMALLSALATSEWPWLVVYDNADPVSLIEAGLIPPGTNSHGRALVTSLVRDTRITSNGHLVTARRFTHEEATGFLTGEVHRRNGVGAQGPTAAERDVEALVEVLDFHPLGLATAMATLVANGMSVTDWIVEFREASWIDDAADERDGGGYPYQVGAAMLVALGRAAAGFDDGVVQRAALVAALQDPDGHPTWIWSSAAVAEWVTGCVAPATSGRRMPAAVRRLAEYGLVELRGGSWASGRLAIHQLVARAVRESFDAETVAEITAILADEWLLSLTDGPEPDRRAVWRNVRPMPVSEALPEAAELVVKALRVYARPQSAWSVAFDLGYLQQITQHLEQGGVIGRAELADKYLAVGVALELIRRGGEARVRFAQALTIYDELCADATVEDDLKADYHEKAGEVEERIGSPESARARYRRSADMHERLIESELGADSFGRSVVSLVRLYERLGDVESARCASARGTELEVRARSLMAESVDSADVFGDADRLTRIGRQLRTLGRLDEARLVLERAAEANRTLDVEFFRRRVHEEIARVHIARGEWQEAADALSPVVTGGPSDTENEVVLASALVRIGQSDEALEHLSRLAESYLEGIHDTDDTDLPSDDSVEAEFGSAFMRVMELNLQRLQVHAMERERWEDVVGLTAGILEVVGQRADRDPVDQEERSANAHRDMGDAYVNLDRADEAAHHYSRAADAFRLLADLDPNGLDHRRKLGGVLAVLASLEHRLHPSQGHRAVATAAQAVTELETVAARALDEDPFELARALYLLGFLHESAGTASEAATAFERSVELWRSRLDRFPAEPETLVWLPRTLLAWGLMQVRQGDQEGAARLLAQAVEHHEHAYGAAPDDLSIRANLAVSCAYLAALLHEAEPSAATGYARRAVLHHSALADAEPGELGRQSALLMSRSMLAQCLWNLDRTEDAVDELRVAVNGGQFLADLAPGKYEQHLVLCLRELAVWTHTLGRHDVADEYAARADDLARRFPDS
ncbi:hypothetical protein ACFVSK_09245 [Cellulosimicrobium cellulans]|uniref:hypothetical protein n=1 Tax=Cellulosimicrobium cellulans TaxID=1710 RepID=UPI0036F136D6